MIKNFIRFYSPGTFLAETTKVPIDSWDTEEAKRLAHGIKERHGAAPYGFRFTTRSRKEDDLDSKETAQSCMYFLGGKIETLVEVEARCKPDDILLINMRSNGYRRIVTNTNSWKWTQPLEERDVVLDFVP